jgi:competence protein ComGC
MRFRISGMKRLRPEQEAGFTLLDMLVAVAILAALVGIVPRSFVFARSLLDHSRDWMAARLVAESVLNDELARATLEPGVRGGVIEGRRWRATLRPSSLAGAAPSESGRALLDVHISVEVGAGKSLEIDTMRIASGGSE